MDDREKKEFRTCIKRKAKGDTVIYTCDLCGESLTTAGPTAEQSIPSWVVSHTQMHIDKDEWPK